MYSENWYWMSHMSVSTWFVFPGANKQTRRYKRILEWGFKVKMLRCRLGWLDPEGIDKCLLSLFWHVFPLKEGLYECEWAVYTAEALPVSVYCTRHAQARHWLSCHFFELWMDTYKKYFLHSFLLWFLVEASILQSLSHRFFEKTLKRLGKLLHNIFL